MGQMKIEEVRKFLMCQRQKEQQGFIVGVDQRLNPKKERALKRTAIETAMKKKDL